MCLYEAVVFPGVCQFLCGCYGLEGQYDTAFTQRLQRHKQTDTCVYIYTQSCGVSFKEVSCIVTPTCTCSGTCRTVTLECFSHLDIEPFTFFFLTKQSVHRHYIITAPPLSIFSHFTSPTVDRPSSVRHLLVPPLDMILNER